MERRKLLRLAAVSAGAAAFAPLASSAGAALEPLAASAGEEALSSVAAIANQPPTGIAQRSQHENESQGASEGRPQPASSAEAPFTYCLNMATIRGHRLGFVKELQTASSAGYRSVEIWMDSLQEWLGKGGSIKDGASIIRDLDLTIENCIGFAEWIVDDQARRNKAIEQLKREMDLLAKIGCKRLAAPPMGATETPKIDLPIIAERYKSILVLGEQHDVFPQLELWGFSNNLKHVSEVVYAAMESGHPSAKVLLDIFHIFKGGSSLETLHMLNSSCSDIFHMNDYPANIPASVIKDSDRVYPGDGIAPFAKILPFMKKKSSPLVLSFEVFNAGYYKQDPLLVAKTALQKMKAVAEI